MTTTPGVYPVELEADVATRDGSLVHVRPVRPEDTDRLLVFLRTLPDEDRRLRFFSLGNDLAPRGARRNERGLRAVARPAGNGWPG